MRLRLFILAVLVVAVAATSSTGMFSIKDISSKIGANLRGLSQLREGFKNFMERVKAWNPISKALDAAKIDPDVYRSSVEVIMSKGYPLETHYILTEDGYIIMAWRIKKNVIHKYPVMLQHGLLDCSFSWIVNNEQQALPYMLADAGYEVWLTNNRGNRYSKTHSKMTLQDDYKDYWSFSWDEMAKYDVPANVEYIKKKTGVDKIHYVGHSQGTTQWFAHLSMNITQQKSFKSFVGLGPAVFVEHVGGIFSYVVIERMLYELLDFLGLGDLMGLTGDSSALLGEICDYDSFICGNIIKLICGFTVGDNFNATRIPVMSSHEPGGASLRTIHHWLQMLGRPNFELYDFGEKVNMQKYGQKTPPQYPLENLQKLEIPLFLVRGDKDVLVAEADYKVLLEKLPTKNVKSLVMEDWNHLDYVWAMNAHKEVYPQIIKFLQEAESN